MNSLEIICRLCDVIESMAQIVEKQQIEIRRAGVEQSVQKDIQAMINGADVKMSGLDCHLRRLAR